MSGEAIIKKERWNFVQTLLGMAWVYLKQWNNLLLKKPHKIGSRSPVSFDNIQSFIFFTDGFPNCATDRHYSPYLYYM
jgi:hypothetical protein